MAQANLEEPKQFEMKERPNSRNIKENFITGQHVSLQRLKERILNENSGKPMLKYIRKEIPLYPTPVEFCVSEVAHVTDKEGFIGILESEKLNPPDCEFSWWDLKINRKEIKSAKEKYIEKNFPDKAEELNKQKSYLERFTTSPLFKLHQSRYGNYRFTFPLTDLMQWYKEQNCGVEDPVLRVYETITYKQEIVYTVLIHSPEDNQRFKEYPLLEESEWVQYQDRKIIWKAQAICETHWYQLSDSGEMQSLSPEVFYVWDQVSLVFHLPKPKALEIPRERLIEALEVCEIANIDLSKYQGSKTTEERYMEAKEEVSKLKIELKEEEKEVKDEDMEDEDEAKP